MKKFVSSSRAEQLSPFIVMEVLEKAQAMMAQGEDIIHLEVGNPILPPRNRSKKRLSRPWGRMIPIIPTVWAR